MSNEDAYGVFTCYDTGLVFKCPLKFVAGVLAREIDLLVERKKWHDEEEQLTQLIRKEYTR